MNLLFAENINEMTQTQIHTLVQEIDQKSKAEAIKIAAFDADGTLWDTDVGESFFDFQIKKNCFSKNIEASFEIYSEIKKNDPEKAYLWLAQLNAGNTLAQVRKWSNRSFEKNQPRFFKTSVEIIKALQKIGFEIYVVTASIKWAVEPVAKILNIPYDNIIGVQTMIENDIITNKQKGFITYKEGKAKALLEKTSGIKPYLCVGNSGGDSGLLACSQFKSIAYQTQNTKNELFKSEIKLQNLAKENSWIRHQFRS